jgi:uncharacterized membrane-anchored protein
MAFNDYVGTVVFLIGWAVVVFWARKARNAFRRDSTDLEKIKHLSILVLGGVMVIVSLGMIGISLIPLLISILLPGILLIIGIYVLILGRRYLKMKEKETIGIGQVNAELQNLREKMDQIETKIDRIHEILEKVSD